MSSIAEKKIYFFKIEDMATYSFSQIGTYSTCPMKYKFEKIDRLKPEFEENLHLILGTVVHDSLEELYKRLGVFSIMSDEELIIFFNQKWQEKIKKLKEGEMIKYTDEEIENFHKRWVVYLEEYYATYRPLDQDRLFATEQDVTFSLSEDIGFRWKIDRLDMQGDDIIINDYKTNTKIPTDAKDKIQQQINLYGFGIKQLYASKVKKIFWRVYYLHFNTSYQWEITDDIVKKVQEEFLAISQEIEAKTKLFKKGNQNAFETKVGTHCEYCPFKVICPARKHEMMKDDTLEKPIDDIDSIRKLIDKYKKISDEIDILDEKKKFYKEILVNYAKEQGVNKLFSDLYKMSLTTRESYSINEEDEDKVIEKLKEDWVYWDLLKLDTSKFTKFLKEGKIDPGKFEDFVEHKETMYINRVSEKKDDKSEDK